MQLSNKVVGESVTSTNKTTNRSSMVYPFLPPMEQMEIREHYDETDDMN